MASEKQVHREQADQLESAPKRKKRYQKPAFRYEKVFETLALICGKVSSTQAGCQASRKSS